MAWMTPRLSRSFARWLVGMMLIATLAPAVSRSLSAMHQPGDWVEICTVQGMRWVRLGERDGRLPGGLAQALDRCGHCLLASERFAPLVPGVPELADSGASWLEPPHTPVGLGAVPILSPTARGPPLLS